MPSTATKKKRKKTESTDEDPSVGKKSYEELEKELLETKQKLSKAEAQVEELKAKTAASTEESISSDDEESVAEDPNDTWTIKFKALREYRIINGDCMVPRKNAMLGSWVDNQRTAYKNMKGGKKGKKITDEKVNKLESIGFFWGKTFPALATWEDRFEELQKYQKAMGNCNIHISMMDPSPLAKWVSAQRSEYKRFKKGRDSLLSLDQLEHLNGIGFNWKGRRLS